LRAYSAPWSSYLDLRGPTSKKKEGKRRENVGKRKGLGGRKGSRNGKWRGGALADLGFFRGGDFANPSERSERALRGSRLIRDNEIARNRLELTSHT